MGLLGKRLLALKILQDKVDGLSGWNDVERMSPHGAALLVNSMVLSRYRYWASCMFQPKDIMDAIDKDARALVWGRDFEMDPDAVGNDCKVRVWAGGNNQFNSRRSGGIGLLHWGSHTKALAVRVLFEYVNGELHDWKTLLDWWLARFQEGRGAIFTTIPTTALISRGSVRRSRLPKFFRFALHSLRELRMRPVRLGVFLSPDEARAEPVWTSPRIDLTDRRWAERWRYDLSFNRVLDMIDPSTNLLYDKETMMLYFD